jgi:hypothetical protein
MPIIRHGIEIGEIYISKDRDLIIKVTEVSYAGGRVYCKTQFNPDKITDIPLKDFDARFKLLELAPRGRYKPLDENTRANLTAQIIRSNRKNDTVTFWCGGQKLTDSYKKFAMEYRRESWAQTDIKSEE